MVKQEADVVATSLTLTLERNEVVNFVLPVGFETYAIFISKSGASEEMSWTTFLLPFSDMLWLALFVNALFIACFMRTFHHFLQRKRESKACISSVMEAISNYWMVFCSYLGRKPTSFPTDRDGRKFFQLVTFVVLFCGNIIFMAYRASLTSELSTRKSKLPFTSLEELHDSDYR